MTIEKLCENNIKYAKEWSEHGMRSLCKILGYSEEQTEHAVKTIFPLIESRIVQSTERLNEHTRNGLMELEEK